MRKLQSLVEISKLNGRFTKALLKGRGINENAISTAIKTGLLTYDNSGVVSTVFPSMRERKLREAVGTEIIPGRQVGVLGDEQGGNAGTLNKMQVVKDMGNGSVLVIDPENPNSPPVEVPLNKIALDNDKDDDISQDAQQPQGQPASPAAPTTPSPTL